MECKQQEQILLTHFQNLRALSTEQLEAVRQGKTEHLDDILAQKQMIIDHIITLQAETGPENYQTETKGQMRKLIAMIMGLEEESRQMMQKCSVAVQREMVSLRQENQLNEKYNTLIETSQFLDESQ